MQSHSRQIASLFTLKGINYVTLLDNRSRRSFKKLMKDWAGADNFNIPNKGDSFEYLPLDEILDDIESTYKGFEKTPATEKLARDVFRLIDQIRVQNDGLSFRGEEENTNSSENDVI